VYEKLNPCIREWTFKGFTAGWISVDLKSNTALLEKRQNNFGFVYRESPCERNSLLCSGVIRATSYTEQEIHHEEREGKRRLQRTRAAAAT
jgi:hypothetical protein